MSTAIQQSKSGVEPNGEATAALMLSIGEFIARFESRLGGVLDYDSFEFNGRGEPGCFSTGRPMPHSCTYLINISEELCLGKITLTRMTPFRESELQVLETCLSDLFLQLRSLNPLAD